MKKNSGQVLVLFVLILPIIFMILALCIDVGLIYMEKRKVDNVVREAIEYGLDIIENDNVQEQVEEYINKNVDNIDVLNININNQTVSVECEKKQNGIFSFILGSNRYQLTSNWYGYKADEKIKIVKK